MFGIDDAIGIAGMGVSLFGGLEASKAAREKAQTEMQISGLEMQENQQRRLAMEMSNRRLQMETTRKSQVMRAMSEAAGVANSGGAGGAALQSSGVQGGMAAATASGAWNVAGMAGQLQIGEKMFDITNAIDAAKMSIAGEESKEASGMGLMSLGKGISSLGGMNFLHGMPFPGFS